MKGSLYKGNLIFKEWGGAISTRYKECVKNVPQIFITKSYIINQKLNFCE